MNKPTLTPTQYQSLSEEDKGLYEEVWQYWHKYEHGTVHELHRVQHTHYNGYGHFEKYWNERAYNTLQIYRLKEPKKKPMRIGIVETGANWQASNPDNISRALVIEILQEWYITPQFGPLDEMFADLIEKIKAL